MKAITLINPFAVLPEQEEEFLKLWKAADAYMKQQKGFISTQLNRSLDWESGLTAKPFRFVNIAKWKSTEDFRAAVSTDEFRNIAKAVLPFSKGPGLYDVICE